MTRLTIYIYKYFQSHKKTFYAILLVSSALFIFLGSRIRYEEDITKLLPSTADSDGSEKLAFANLKVKDKVFLLFSSKSDSVTPSKLAAACDEFIDTLLVKDRERDSTITDVLYKLDDAMLMNAVGFLQQNIPTFLEESDYNTIDSLISQEQLDQQMTENFMMLCSPSGIAFQDMIIQDPLAFRNIFKDKMSTMQKGLGGNFIVHEHHLFVPDTTVALGFLSPSFKSFDSKASNKLVQMMEDEIIKFKERHPEIDIHYHGTPVQSVYNARQIKSDLLTTLGVSLLIICVAIGYCFRNKSTLFFLIAPVAYGSFFALSVLYLIKGSISLLAMGIGAIVLGVALSYCLHVITHYKYVSDPVKVLEDQTVPVILGCLTTIGAFSSLMFTEAELLKDFGLFASLALAGTTIFCLIFLPHFFNPENNRRSDKAFSLMEKINSYPFEKNTILIASILGISVICLYTKGRVKFDSDLVNIGYHAPHVVESQNILAEKTANGYKTVYYATSSDNLDTALVYNKKMLQILDSLQNTGLIKSYSKASELFIPQEEQERRIKRWEEYWTPEKIEQLRKNVGTACQKSEYNSAIYEDFFNSLSKKYQTNSIYESGIIPSELMSNLIEQTDGTYMVFTPVQLKNEDKRRISDIVTSHKHCVVIDPFYYTNDMVELINSDFETTLLISSLFVFIVLLISFKSVIIATLAFIPMSLSWYIVLGIMGIFGLKFNLINIVISTFIFGMGVDYSIFIMDGLLTNFRTRTKLLVYHKTAIVFSAFVLIIGISSLMIATHPAISSIGISTLIGMSSAVIISYTILPFLFYWLIKRPTLRGKAPITLYNLFNAEAYFKEGKMTDKQKIRNNYEYKGYPIESELRRELIATSDYEAISNVLPAQGNILDFGCEHGYATYWCYIKDTRNKVVGFDTDETPLTIAKNCYLKTSRICFESDTKVLNDEFDIVIINRNIESLAEKLKAVISSARVVVIRKSEGEDYVNTCKSLGLSKTDEDDLFYIFSK